MIFNKNIDSNKEMSSHKVVSLWRAGLMSSIFANFKTLKFILKTTGFLERSLPLWDGFCWEQKRRAKRVGGWKTHTPVKFHPLTPASGGNSPLQVKNLRRNFNSTGQAGISADEKQNLTALRLGGGKTLLLFLLLQLIFFSSCEDEIRPELEDAPEIVAIDAWITNKPEPQVIRLNGTQEYFDNTVPAGLSGANVQVVDENLKVYDFVETASGEYTWTPQAGETFGQIGVQYGLNIEYNGVTYNSISKMNGVPPVDSISFTFEEEDGPFPEGYFAEFWSRDLAGEGDTYWIKTFKNGVYQGNPDEINLAFDAGFSSGGNIDGFIFIAPIRFGVNSFEEDENGDLLAPYVPGDSIYVELHSITNEAFFFLTEVQFQTDRPGGFAELFATPLSNVATNIIPSDENTEVVGFFNVSAVSGNGKKLVE